MSGLTLFSLAVNVWLLYRLVRKTDECNVFQKRASHWLQRYNEEVRK